MSIFPDGYGRNINKTTITESATPKLLKEYAIDFEKSEFLLDENNKFIIVEGIEAVKIRNWLALKIQRNRYLMYMNIGNNLKSLIGKDLSYVNKNIQSILDEALIDEYTTSIENIEVAQDNDKFTVEFTINTIYGSYSKQESW